MSAYGTARGFRLNVPLLALVAGSLVLAAALVIAVLRMSVPLPEHTVFLVAARPAALNNIMTLPTLQRDLPAPWRAVLGTNSHFPALFGIALDRDGRAHSFAIVPKTTLLGELPGLVHAPHGLYRLVSVDPLLVDATDLRDLPVSVAHTFGRDASFMLRGDLLSAWAFHLPFEENKNALVRGTWDDGVGTLDVRDHATVTAQEIDGSLFSIVTHSSDTRPPIVAGLLSQGVDLRDASALPTKTTLAVSPLGRRALALTWPDPLSDTDRSLLPEAATFFDTTHMRLLEATTTTSETMPPSPLVDCPGTPHFVLEGNLLQETLGFLGLAESWQAAVQGFGIHQKDDQVLLCIWG